MLYSDRYEAATSDSPGHPDHPEYTHAPTDDGAAAPGDPFVHLVFERSTDAVVIRFWCTEATESPELKVDFEPLQSLSGDVAVAMICETFFDEVPREIEEAALVEGCSWFRVFWKITLPMVKAALASTALFVFILNWSDYVIALLLTRKEWVTIPVYMNALSTAMTGQMYGAKAALGLIAAVPPVVFGIAIQKYLVRGLTFGALKQ